MKKTLAAVTAGMSLMTAPVAAADSPASVDEDLRAMAGHMTAAYCAYRREDSTGLLCGDAGDRAHIARLFDRAVTAALAGDVPQSLMMYSVPKAEILAVSPYANTDFFDLRLGMAAAHGVCARRQRETGAACTPAEAASLRHRLRRAYADGRVDAADLPAPVPVPHPLRFR